MILVSLGTQDFPFNRLLEEIDRLMDKGIINEEVYAQVGYTRYQARNFRTEAFTDFQAFDKLLEECSYLITHGGTGTIVGALRKGKKVIAVPRLAVHNEHVDDHQKEIIGLFSEQNLIIGVSAVEELEQAVQQIGQATFRPFVSGNDGIIRLIGGFLDTIDGQKEGQS